MIVRLDRSMTDRDMLRELLRLAGPLMLGNLFYSLQVSIDRICLSRFHPEAPGAALAAAMIVWIFIVCLQNTAGFAVTFVAQYSGAGRNKDVGPIVWQGVWVGVVGGLIGILAVPFAASIFAFIGHSQQMQVWEAEYFQCLCFTALPISVQAAAIGFYSGRGQTALAIWINSIGFGINALLNPILIFGLAGFPECGVAGAGWATVIASYVSAAVAMLLMCRAKYAAEFGTRTGWRIDRIRMLRLLKFGVPNGLQSAADVVTWTAFTLFVGLIGPSELAATNVVFVVNSLFFIPMVGLGQAAGVFVGQRLGEERPELAERGVHLGIAVTVAFMGLMGLLTASSPGIVCSLFANEHNPSEWRAVAELVPSLLWFLAVYSVFDGLNVLLAFSLRGAGDTRFVSLVFLLVGVFGLIVPMYLVVRGGGGLYATWTIATIYLVVLTVVIGARWRYGAWKSMRVIERVPI